LAFTEDRFLAATEQKPIGFSRVLPALGDVMALRSGRPVCDQEVVAGSTYIFRKKKIWRC